MPRLKVSKRVTSNFGCYQDLISIIIVLTKHTPVELYLQNGIKANSILFRYF